MNETQVLEPQSRIPRGPFSGGMSPHDSCARGSRIPRYVQPPRPPPPPPRPAPTTARSLSTRRPATRSGMSSIGVRRSIGPQALPKAPVATTRRSLGNPRLPATTTRRSLGGAQVSPASRRPVVSRIRTPVTQGCERRPPGYVTPPTYYGPDTRPEDYESSMESYEAEPCLYGDETNPFGDDSFGTCFDETVDSDASYGSALDYVSLPEKISNYEDFKKTLMPLSPSSSEYAPDLYYSLRYPAKPLPRWAREPDDPANFRTDESPLTDESRLRDQIGLLGFQDYHTLIQEPPRDSSGRRRWGTPVLSPAAPSVDPQPSTARGPRKRWGPVQDPSEMCPFGYTP